jgi:hypothetical protein
MSEARPEGRPGRGGAAEQERQALFLVDEADAVVDGGEPAAAVELGPGLGRVVVADDEGVPVGDGGLSPFAEAVVAAVCEGECV